MSSPAISNVIKMMESLPIELQDRIVEHLILYIDNIQGQVEGNKSLEESQSQLLIDLQNSQLEHLLDFYTLRNIDADFSKGPRSFIRYAHPTCTNVYRQVNQKGHEPLEYLNWAKLDLALNDNRGASNALHNAKLAVHLTIEKILEVFGLNKVCPPQKNFPTKLKIIKKLEIFPTKFIDLLNQKRNEVEHDYVAVNPAEVESFIEAAEFLLIAAYPILRHAIIGAIIGIDNDNHSYEWRINQENCQLLMYSVQSQQDINTDIGLIHYDFLENSPKKLIKQISILKEHESEWFPAISLFAYLTKRSALKLSSKDILDGNTILEHNIRIF